MCGFNSLSLYESEKMSQSKVISFRLTEEQMKPFAEGLAAAKNQSTFFKEVILSSSPEKAARNLISGTNEYAKFNFLLYKVSNNINQIAKVLNILALSDFADKAALNKALNNIHALEVAFKSKVL